MFRVMKNNFKFAIAALAAAGIIALPLRVYQLLYAIDKENGFYIEGNFSVPVITGIMIAFVAIVFLLCIPGKNDGEIVNPARNKPVGIAAAFFGGTLIINPLIRHFALAEPTSGDMVSLMFAVAAGISLIALGVRILTNNFGLLNGVLCIFPVLWGCVRLAVEFMKFTTISNISENLYDVLTMVFTLLFFFSSAKLIIMTEPEKSIKRVFMFGLPAAFFGLITTFPRFAIILLGRKELLHETAMPQVSDFVMAVYIIVFLISILLSSMKSGAEFPFAVEAGEPEGEENSGAGKSEFFDRPEAPKPAYETEEQRSGGIIEEAVIDDSDNITHYN